MAAQNDFVIANANGSTVRADINSALQALASLSTGTSAPSTTYANQWWHDETNDILKIRDEANTSWINAFQKVGTNWVPYRNGVLLGPMSTLDQAGIADDLVMSSKRLLLASAAVSSGTLNLSTLAGNTAILSGTVANPNSLGTTQAGSIFVLVYAIGTLTITHNATSRILPTGANISPAAGEKIAGFDSQATGSIEFFCRNGSGGVNETNVTSLSAHFAGDQ